ncbi:hypothetical protein M758_UG039400 [Ceratodon purpureus]|nr:hypothetical protein M758_UG039400 [Ceratodon purpureus]
MGVRRWGRWQNGRRATPERIEEIVCQGLDVVRLQVLILSHKYMVVSRPRCTNEAILADQEKVVVVRMTRILINHSPWHAVSFLRFVISLRKESRTMAFLGNDECNPRIVSFLEIIAGLRCNISTIPSLVG